MRTKPKFRKGQVVAQLQDDGYVDTYSEITDYKWEDGGWVYWCSPGYMLVREKGDPFCKLRALTKREKGL
jgi:hypothetical protein